MFPTSIMAAAFTGAPWRFVQLPSWVRRRNETAQMHWVSWRVRNHYRENKGELRLFGDITGYRYLMTPTVSIMLDIRGRRIETIHAEFTPGGGRIVVRNKSVQVRGRTLKIDSATNAS